MSEELVGLDDLAAAAIAVKRAGFPKAMHDLGAAEPHLVGYIDGIAKQLAGELSLHGAPAPLVQRQTGEWLELVATIIEAMQRGSYRTWVGLVPSDSPLGREGLLEAKNTE